MKPLLKNRRYRGLDCQPRPQSSQTLDHSRTPQNILTRMDHSWPISTSKATALRSAAKLNSIYQKLLEGGGDIPPIPVDFDLLFNNLGFGSIEAMGLSSKQLSDEQHVNRYVVKTNGSPSGLFSLYGNSAQEQQPFTAAALVPADATIAGCGPVELESLVETIRIIMVQFMGPMGEGIDRPILDDADSRKRSHRKRPDQRAERTLGLRV